MCLQQTSALAVFHASGAPLCVEEDASGERVRGDVHVFANATLATQVAACCGPAAPVADVGLEIADAQLLCTVEVFGMRQADGFTRRDDGVAQRVAQDEIGDMQGPAGTVPGVRTARLVFGLAKPRQYVLPTPVAKTFRGPVVVVLVLPADIQHAVNGGRAA